MMNIFIMILLAVFMMGYYMIYAPSTRNAEQTTEVAVKTADLRGIAECATAVHNAQIRDTEFSDICIEQNGIESKFICLNANMSVTDCNPRGRQKPQYRFILTATAPLPYSQYNDMMEYWKNIMQIAVHSVYSKKAKLSLVEPVISAVFQNQLFLKWN